MWLLFLIPILFAVLLIGLAAPFFHWGKGMKPLERWCFGISGAVFLVYLIFGLFYVLKIPWGALWWVVGIAVLLLVVFRRSLYDLLSDSVIRVSLFCYGFVVVWCLLFLSFIMCYHGGGWFGDWMEHYERSLFFLDYMDPDTPITEIYHFTARPPLANMFNALFMALLGRDFFAFQIINCLASTLVFWPLALLLTLLDLKNSSFRNGCFILTGLLLLNPMFMQNVTYAWTKLLASFYILGAFYCFMRAWKESGAGFAFYFWGFLSLAIGLLVHYSVGTYVLVCVLFYFWANRSRWLRVRFLKEVSCIGLLCCAVLLTWFGWAFARYGVETTLTSNTTYTDSARLTVTDNLVKIGNNIACTVVPHPILSLMGKTGGEIEGSLPAVQTRDYFFNIYQTNLIFGIGSFTLFGLAFGFRKWLGAFSPEPFYKENWFWWVVLTYVIGIATHGTHSFWGLIHISSQPLVYLALVMLAGVLYRYSRGLIVLLGICLAVDLYFGVFIHFNLQNLNPESVFLELASLSVPYQEAVDLYGRNIIDNFSTTEKFGFEYIGRLVDWSAGVFWVVAFFVFALFVASNRYLAFLETRKQGVE